MIIDIDNLNKALGTHAVVTYLYELDNGVTLTQALHILEDNKVGDNDENMNYDDADPLSLRQALKHRASPSGARSPTNGKEIILGKNKTKVLDNRNGNNSNKRITNSMSEDQLDNHRSTNGELPWIDPSRDRLTARRVKVIKDAVRKSINARQEGFEGHFKINETAGAILKHHVALKEGTAAARTITPFPMDKEPSVREQLPSAFKESGLLPAKKQKKNVADTNDVAIRTKSYDTRKSLPAEWQDAKDATLAKQRAGQMRTWNAAEGSLRNQPNHEKSALDSDTDRYDRNSNIPNVNGMTRTALPQPNVKGRTPNYVGPDGKSSFPNKEKNWDVNLRKPKPPKQGFDPVNGAI